MTRKTAKAAIAQDRPLRILEAILLGLCLCILALRVTYTEAPTVQMSSMLPANLADTLYTLTVSSLLIFAFIFWLVVRLYRGRLTYHITGMEFGLILFVLAAAIAAAGASDKRAAINQTLMLLGPLFATLLLAQILHTDLRVRLVLAVVVGLGVVSAYQCAEQLFVSNRATIEQYEQNPKMLLDPLGIEPGTFPHFLFEHRLYSQGIRGHFTTSNSAASFSILASFAALVMLLRSVARCKELGNRLSYVLLLGLVLSLAIGLVILLGLTLFIASVLTQSIHGLLESSTIALFFGKLIQTVVLLLLLTVCIGVALLIVKFTQRRRLLPGVLPALAVIVVISGLLLTKSKGGILAFIAGLALFAGLLAFRRQLAAHRRLVLAAAAPLVLLSAGAAGYVIVRYGLQHGSLPGGNSMLVRWQYWTASARMYADHPWTGVGLGNFSNYYPHYKPAPALESVSDPHNVLLSLLTQCGPLGLLGFLAMVFVPLWRLVGPAREVPLTEAEQAPQPFRRPAMLILFVVLGSLMLLRPMLIPTSSGGGVEVFLYEIVALYIAPAAAFLIGFVLITAPLEQTLPPSSRFGRTILPAAITSAILAVLLHNLIDFAIFEPGVWMTFWVAMACLAAGDPQPQADAPAARQVPHAWRAAIVAGIVLLVGVYYFYVWRPVWSTTIKMQNALHATSVGRFDQAHNDLDAAFAIDPLSSVTPNLNGRLYLQQYEMARSKQPELLEKAAKYLRRAIGANPADYRNYEKVALAYGYGQRWQDAHDWYLKAAELYPGCERLWFKLGQAAEQLGKPDAALTYYTKAVQIEESYQQQFRRMYPTREKVISRLGDNDLATARKRIEELSARAGNK